MKKNGNGSKPGDGGNLDDIRKVLRETVAIQRQQARILRQHAGHDKRMAPFDVRMEQIQTNIQALIDLIRNKAEPKRR